MSSTSGAGLTGLSIAAALVLVFAGFTRAHDPLADLLAKKRAEIELHGMSAERLLERAELHRQLRHWDQAYADYGRAHGLDPQLVAVHWGQARLFMDLEWYPAAARAVTRFLEAEPEHSGAHCLYARVLARRGQVPAAVAEYTLAIRHASEPCPDLYIERARTLARAGREHLPEALAGLAEARTSIPGRVVAIELVAVDLEIELGRVDAALERVNALAESSPRKEQWWLRKAEILLQAGRPEEARASYRIALAALEQLPTRRRRTQAVVDLELKIRSGLEACDFGGIR